MFFYDVLKAAMGAAPPKEPESLSGADAENHQLSRDWPELQTKLKKLVDGLNH
jgi:hypothetical protein